MVHIIWGYYEQDGHELHRKESKGERATDAWQAYLGAIENHDLAKYTSTTVFDIYGD